LIATTDRRILRLAVPALGALAVEPLYVLVDTAIVGRLGTDQLAGLALAAVVLSFVVAGSNFLTYGTTERVARRHGAGDSRGAAEVGVQALWLSAFVGIVAVGVLVAATRPIAEALGGSGPVLQYAVEYLRISAVGVPFVLFALAAQGILRGLVDYRTPLVILLAANAANVVIEVVLVFGLGYGIAGSAWSTVVSQAGAAAAFVFVVRGHLAAARLRRPDRAGLAPLITAGRHLLVRVGAMLAVFAGATAIAARIDPQTLAAHQVVMSLFMFVALSLDALAVPAQTLVAGELGAGAPTSAADVARRVVVLSVITGVGLGALLALAAPLLPHLFTADPAVADHATTALFWLAVLLVPAAVAFAHDGILIGAGDYRFLGVASAAYLIAMVPVGLVLLRYEQLGIGGIWAGLTVWVVLRATVNHLRTRYVVIGSRAVQA
jgi:putative MATE family efflux protein